MSLSLNIHIYLAIGCVSDTKNSFENNPLDSYISTGGLCLNMELHGAID